MFQLRKWYFDCVTDEGTAAILYRASAKWGPLALNYGASLHRRKGGVPVHRHTLRPGNKPDAGDRNVQWTCPNLDVTGEWSVPSTGLRRTLLDAPEGSIHWHCVSPGAAAEVRIGDVQLAGTGYVEHLTMTLTPWRLPFNELRWGRFIGQKDTLAWILWRGQTSRTWAWLNGVEHSCCKVCEERIEIPRAGLLRLSGQTVLRSGPLATTALRPVRAFVGLMPRWRFADETKWLARGTLERTDGSDTGWVIHEIVRWP